MPTRPYTVKRFKLWFNKGALFYANLNFRLFFYLLFKKADWLLANDLDTLPANYYASKFKRKCKLVYDTHEVFCEVPELQHSKFKKKVWLYFERKIFPKLSRVYTVNTSIANYYSKLYGVTPLVVRNISQYTLPNELQSRSQLGLPLHKFIVIIQGSGINVDRGNEEVVEAFKHLNEDYFLVIAGSGDVITKLKKYVNENHLNERVLFKNRMNYDLLMQYTANCNLGISLDKATNLNYQYSLPNKIFDFIHARVPVLASNLPEIAHITKTYGTGVLIDTHNPLTIAETIQQLHANEEMYLGLKDNCKKASQKLTWENEALMLKKIYTAD